MTTELIALLNGKEVGRVRRDARNRLTFTYDEGWRTSRDAYPLSLSMPLAAAEHRPTVVQPFLWGLLPDNELILERWARKFQVSARNVFALIVHVGEDCAGAVQLVTSDRLDAAETGKDDKVDWLKEHEIADRLRKLRQDHAAWRLPGDAGQFSLAGAQPKTALLLQNRRWGIPSGRTPTTHILKPPTGQFDGHAENEHFCLGLANELGLPTALSRVMHFEDQTAIVIERYDRLRKGNDIVRIHQEDICQALGLMPSKKYQNDGGPGPLAIVDLLRSYSSDPEADVDTFVDALGFNWLIAGPDAHAKNYSMLVGAGSHIRLAPLYDIASALPYDTLDTRKIKSAMKIGGEYRLHEIGLRDWQRLARELRVDAERTVERLQAMAARLPDCVRAVHARSVKDGLDKTIMNRLAERLVEWIEGRKRLMTMRGA